MGIWAEQLRRDVRVLRGKNQDEVIPSVKFLCREIGMSERIYRGLVAGDTSNLRNYLRVIFWCMDQCSPEKRKRLMFELATRLRAEFE